MNRKLIRAIYAVALLGLSGVVAYAAKVRIYDMETGAVSVLQYKNNWLTGHGELKGTLAAGQTVGGEFTTVPKSSTTWGSIYGTGGYSSGNITSVSGAQRGSAIVTGDGIVLECEYVVSALTGHGSGSCRDNRGKRYRIMF